MKIKNAKNLITIALVILVAVFFAVILTVFINKSTNHNSTPSEAGWFEEWDGWGYDSHFEGWENSYLSGKGTAADPYLIGDEQDAVVQVNNVIRGLTGNGSSSAYNEDLANNVNFKITEDLVFSGNFIGMPWSEYPTNKGSGLTPIGIFDFDYHTVTIENTNGLPSLFIGAEGLTVKNLKLVYRNYSKLDVEIFGGIVAWVYGTNYNYLTTSFINCYVDVAVSIGTVNYECGGLVGRTENDIIIKNSCVVGFIYANKIGVSYGAFVGGRYGAALTTENSYANLYLNINGNNAINELESFPALTGVTENFNLAKTNFFENNSYNDYIWWTYEKDYRLGPHEQYYPREYMPIQIGFIDYYKVEVKAGKYDSNGKVVEGGGIGYGVVYCNNKMKWKEYNANTNIYIISGDVSYGYISEITIKPETGYKYSGKIDEQNIDVDINNKDSRQIKSVVITIIFEVLPKITIKQPYLNGSIASTNVATISGTLNYENVELGVNITATYNTKTNVYTIQIGNNNAVTITILDDKYILEGFYYNALNGKKIGGGLELVETMLTPNKELIIYPKLVKKSYNVTLG